MFCSSMELISHPTYALSVRLSRLGPPYSQGHTMLSRKSLTLNSQIAIPSFITFLTKNWYSYVLHWCQWVREGGGKFESVRIFNSHQLIVLMTSVLNNAFCVGVRQLNDTNIVQVSTLYESTLWIPLPSTSNPTAINIVFTDCVASVHVYLIVNITTKA